MSSYMQGFERDTWIAVLSSKRVWLVHVITNALLMIGFFYWTRIPEETGWQFALTLVGGLVIAIVALWLHSATFDYFRLRSGRCFKSSLRRSVARIPAFLMWTIVFGLVLWLIGQLWDYEQQIGGWSRHALPLFLRREIGPRSMISASHWVTWFLYFFLWPILFLPVAGQVAVKNFRGFYGVAALRPVREMRFWLTYLICFVIGAYVPYTLAWVVPRKPSSLSTQEWSMVLRLGLGYLLLVTGWVVLCAAIMRTSGGENVAGEESLPAPAPAMPVS